MNRAGVLEMFHKFIGSVFMRFQYNIWNAYKSNLYQIFIFSSAINNRVNCDNLLNLSSALAVLIILYFTGFSSP